MNEKFPGLYIHIPFCLSKCLYCDFYSLTSISAVPDFLDALFKEMEMYRNRFNPFDPSAAPRLRRELSRTPALQSRDNGALRVNPEQASASGRGVEGLTRSTLEAEPLLFSALNSWKAS